MPSFTSRAAVVVPTAFLVAASGLATAPALATNGTLPAAAVNGAADSDTATVTRGGVGHRRLPGR